MTRSENIPLNLIWIIPAQGYASPLLCHCLLIPRPVLLILNNSSVADTSERNIEGVNLVLSQAINFVLHSNSLFYFSAGLYYFDLIFLYFLFSILETVASCTP
jgi:hypothetical protein